MAVSDFALQQAALRAATTLEQLRVICDRTHEENLLSQRTGVDAQLHYAYALGTIMAIVTLELQQLEKLGIKRADTAEEANQRALASLAAFKNSLRASGLG